MRLKQSLSVYQELTSTDISSQFRPHQFNGCSPSCTSLWSTQWN